MALKARILRHKIDRLNAELEERKQKDAEFDARAKELEEDADNVTDEEGKNAVNADVEKFEKEKAEHEAEKERLASEISSLEKELTEEEERQKQALASAKTETEHREKENKNMETRKFYGYNADEILSREDVKGFLTRVRDFGGQQRVVTGAELTIPTVILDIVREEVARDSKLLKYVNRKYVRGNAKQQIVGNIPEAVWTEMCARINELSFAFNEIDVDAHKVAGYIPICNSILADSDINLAREIVEVLSASIAKAIDNAILWGDGNTMPLGIATRLAQTSQPASWGAKAPAWTDLHASNVLTLDISSSTGAAFFAELVAALGVARPVVSSDGLFWVMNRKTHLAILAKALNFNANGMLVAGVDKMPVVGGDIVEFEDARIADNTILGGFGGNYLMAEREGVEIASSEHAMFIEDHTVFRGKARYDGMPIFGEAFVAVNFDNESAATSHEFPVDYANTEMNVLTVTAAAGTASGDTVLTVSNTLDASAPVLKYKAKATVNKLNVGDVLPTGWNDLTSGTTQITAAAGVQIAVVELDDNGRVVSAGQVASVPKA